MHAMLPSNLGKMDFGTASVVCWGQTDIEQNNVNVLDISDCSVKVYFATI